MTESVTVTRALNAARTRARGPWYGAAGAAAPQAALPTRMFDRGRIVRLAKRYREAKKLPEALHEYDKLLAIDAADLSVLRAAAELELEHGTTAGAADRGERLASQLAERGFRLAALYRYRKVLELLGAAPATRRERVAAAMDRLKTEVRERRRKLVSYDEAALVLEKRGRDADAVELLGQMIAIEPDNPVFHARRAETYCRLSRKDEAIPAFRLAARALVEFDRRSDALKVLERILHFHAEPEDALFAASLYLDRAEPNDAIRAIAKLQLCLTRDPESLDALSLLARAFGTMGQPARATQVRVEMARIAKESGELDLLRDLLAELSVTAPRDPIVEHLVDHQRPLVSSAPALSVRSSFASVLEDDLAPLAGARSQSDSSVLDELSFEEVSVLSGMWVMPVLTRAASRALEDAEAFMRLHLYLKAEDALLNAIEEDPVCGELREALRGVYRERGDTQGFVEETLVLADLYRQRRFFERARTLLADVFAVEPDHDGARRLAADLEGPARDRFTAEQR
jgi:pilus assembly protein FimV